MSLLNLWLALLVLSVAALLLYDIRSMDRAIRQMQAGFRRSSGSRSVRDGAK